MATVMIGSARINEKGTVSGGRPGDQKSEVSEQAWYEHSKDWVDIRAKTKEMRKYIAECMRKACANPHIGYDQPNRLSLYNASKPFGFDPSKVTTDVQCDCSSLVRVCILYALRKVGITKDVVNFRTVNEPANLKATGYFEILTDKKYTTSPDYLQEGDILCTPVSGHTVVVLNDGKMVNVGGGGGSPAQTTYGPINPQNVPTLNKGDEGDAVAYMQSILAKLGYSLSKSVKKGSKYGYDGEWGDETEKAFKAFQQTHKDIDGKALLVDTECGPKSWGALLGVRCAQKK